jgi:hypothetical protein
MRPASLRNWLLALACCVFALSGLLAQEPPGGQLSQDQLDNLGKSVARHLRETREEEQRKSNPFGGSGEWLRSHFWLLPVLIALAYAIDRAVRRRE